MTKLNKEVLLSTTDSVYNHTILEHVGIVMDEVHFYKPFTISQWNSNIRDYKNNVTKTDTSTEFIEIRNKLLLSLKEKAVNMGANAVVGVRFDYYNGIFEHNDENGKFLNGNKNYCGVFVSGTAVIINDIKNDTENIEKQKKESMSKIEVKKIDVEPVREIHEEIFTALKPFEFEDNIGYLLVKDSKGVVKDMRFERPLNANPLEKALFLAIQRNDGEKDFICNAKDIGAFYIFCELIDKPLKSKR